MFQLRKLIIWENHPSGTVMLDYITIMTKYIQITFASFGVQYLSFELNEYFFSSKDPLNWSKKWQKKKTFTMLQKISLDFGWILGPP